MGSVVIGWRSHATYVERVGDEAPNHCSACSTTTTSTCDSACEELGELTKHERVADLMLSHLRLSAVGPFPAARGEGMQPREGHHVRDLARVSFFSRISRSEVPG